jgi:myo-inositol-1(or 4)-monophosphatase
MSLDQIKTVLSDCLAAAAAIQRTYLARVGEHGIVEKTRDIDIQTIADVESERAVVARIHRAFPDHAILSEESGEFARPGATARWIVDPLDGTLNYRHGFPYCAISIAVEVAGEVTLGAVYNPFREDLFQAERGRGATHNGKAIRVSAESDLRQSLIVAGLPYDRRERIDHYLGQVRTMLLEAQAVLRLGSAALDLCMVAAGQSEAYFEENIQLWDWAAGRLIVEEAGGRVTDYHGEARLEERRQVCASNGAIHGALLALLEPTVTR